MKLSLTNPFAHIPKYAPYPGSSNDAWHQIPLGVGKRNQVFWETSWCPMALITGSTGGGKSVIQRNIIFHCIQHPDHWRFIGIDLTKVELTPYAKYDDVVMGIATNLADGVEALRYATEEMMSRYKDMVDQDRNYFRDLREPPHALMVMIDEAYMFLAKSEADSAEETELKADASKAISDITRLGRAAGIHLVISTQRTDATIISPEMKENFVCRIAAGKIDPTTSQFVFGNDNAVHLPSDIKGRGYIQARSPREEFQSYYAEQGWIDKFLAGK